MKNKIKINWCLTKWCRVWGRKNKPSNKLSVALCPPQWMVDFDKLPRHYEPVPNTKHQITTYVERQAVLKFIAERLTKEDLKHYDN